MNKMIDMILGMVSLEKSSIRALDIRTDIFSNFTPDVTMRITHLPTGITVEGRGRVRHRLSKSLIEELESKVAKHPV